MPEIQPTYYAAPWSGGTSQGASATLGTITANGATNWVNTFGFAGRIYVAVVNGITNGVTYNVQGSEDATTWVTLATRADSSASYATTAVTTPAASTGVLYLNPIDVPRFLRVNVTSANSNGTTFRIWMER
jgi:hypothetical protein